MYNDDGRAHMRWYDRFMDDGQKQRARARASWPMARARLDDDASPLLLDIPAADRVAMVWALTLDAWAMRGAAIPDYPRSQAPGCVVRRTKP